MNNITAKYNTEVIDCPKCGGKGKTACYRTGTATSTASNYFECKCELCEGKGKLEKTEITTTIYKFI